MSGATDHLMPDEARVLAPAEFASTAGLTEHELHELQEYQLLPAGELDLRTALALREAVRLRGDFDLDLFATGLLALSIRRVHELEAQLQQLQAHARTPRAVYTEVSFTAVEVRHRPR